MTDASDSLTWWSWLWRWRPTSDKHLEEAETKMLSGLKIPYKNVMVKLRSGYTIRTLVLPAAEPCTPERLPLVMVQGFGAGVAFWVMNLTHLARHQTVYAIDVLGFGRSSRPQFPSDPAEAEKLFVDSLEDWRHEIGLEKFVLLGHSFGGYLVSAYTLAHTHRVRHLVLADPWGIAEKNSETEKSFQIPWWARGILSVVLLMNPVAPLRGIGPLGPYILRKVRSDIGKKFDSFLDGEGYLAIDYLYHILAQTPSGETAFMSLTIPYGWGARFPMHPRLTKKLDPSVPISVFFGTRSWMYIRAGLDLKHGRPESYVEFDMIPDASHHCYADDAKKFNEIVETACTRVHENRDNPGDEGTEKDFDLENLDNFGSFLRPR